MKTPTLADFPAYVEAVLKKVNPVPPADYRRHIADTKIVETMRGWGFGERFQREQKMDGKQAATFRNMQSKLTGCGAIVALVGERGLGKTTLAAQFALEHAWANYEGSLTGGCVMPFVIYRKCQRIISRFKPLYADYGSVETETLEQAMRFLCEEQEFLIIDEVHDCNDQKMKTRVLTDLIDRRYASLRDTVLIANQTPDDFKATIGDSILSRLGEHGAILPCKWESFRTP